MRDLINLVERAQPQFTPAFRTWFGNSKTVDEHGQPLVLYHGTGSDVSSFRGIVWGSASHKLASEYAAFRELNGGSPSIMPVYMRIERPFNADLGLPKTVKIGEFFGAITEQGMDNGFTIDEARRLRALELINIVREGARAEESGPHYARHDFWFDPASYFGKEGAAAILEFFKLFGFDGVQMIENDTLTFGAFTSQQVKSVFNAGGFNPDSEHISEALIESQQGTYTVYHGSNHPDISEFRFDDLRHRTGTPGTLSFSLSRDVAKIYGKYIYEAEVSGNFGDYQNADDVEKVVAYREEESRNHPYFQRVLTTDADWQRLFDRQRREITEGQYSMWENVRQWKALGWDGAWCHESEGRNLIVGRGASIQILRRIDAVMPIKNGELQLQVREMRNGRHSFTGWIENQKVVSGEFQLQDHSFDDKGSVEEISVDPSYRRRGIATAIYDYFEKVKGYRVVPSDDVRSDGQKFWDSRGRW